MPLPFKMDNPDPTCGCGCGYRLCFDFRDPCSGLPVSGIQVEVGSGVAYGYDDVGTCETDADGTCCVEVPGPGDYWATGHDPSGTYEDWDGSVLLAGPEYDFLVTLERAVPAFEEGTVQVYGCPTGFTESGPCNLPALGGVADPPCCGDGCGPGDERNGEPGATVTLTGPASYGATTDASGQATLTVTVAGTYSLTITKPRFKTYSGSVDIICNAWGPVIQLAPDDGYNCCSESFSPLTEDCDPEPLKDSLAAACDTGTATLTYNPATGTYQGTGTFTTAAEFKCTAGVCSVTSGSVVAFLEYRCSDHSLAYVAKVSVCDDGMGGQICGWLDWEGDPDEPAFGVCGTRSVIGGAGSAVPTCSPFEVDITLATDTSACSTIPPLINTATITESP